MKHIFIASFIICSGAFGQTNDSTAIARFLIEDYKTLGTWDYKDHEQHCLPYYQLIENGEIMSLEDELNYFKKNAHRKINRTDSFYFKSIRVRGDVGYAVYELKSAIEENGKVRYRHWSESVVCERTSGGWKLALLHSTPIEDKK